MANREQLPVPCDTMNLELKLRDPQLPQPKAAGFCVSGAMSVLKLSGFLPGRSRQISRCGSDNPFSRTFSACYLNTVASDHCVRYLAQLAACSLIATGSSRSAVLLICSHKSKFTIFQENVMTQNAWKYVIAVSLFSAYTLAAVPLFGQALTQPVQVVNTPNVNVVNTPSVSVTNTPSVSVSNTPSVNVANTPTVALEAGAGVNVSSPLDGEGNPTPLAVLDAVQPYEDSCFIFFAGSNSGNCSFQAIPSGKRLVTQEFDAAGTLETGLKPVFIGFETNSTAPHFFPATFMASANGYDNFATHQETRLYAPPSAAPFCFVGVTSNSNGNYGCEFSGFLVDVPLGSSGAVAPGVQRQHPALPNGRNPGLGRQPNNTGR